MEAMILYIDDSEPDIALMCIKMEQENIQVEAEQCAEIGIAAYDPQKHHVVVVDWNMAKMEGLEVARKLRQKHPACPIMFISGRFTDDRIAAAQAAGIHNCVEKSMDFSHIECIAAFARSIAGRCA